MNKLAAIQGTFTGIKPIPSRSVMQIVVEVAIEQADQALIALGGIPQPGSPKHVALALLDNKLMAVDEKAKKQTNKPELTEEERARTRAVILCEDPQFMRWLGASNNKEASEILRRIIGAKSRSEIATDQNVRNRFIAIEIRFCQETGRMAEARS